MSCLEIINSSFFKIQNGEIIYDYGLHKNEKYLFKILLVILFVSILIRIKKKYSYFEFIKTIIQKASKSSISRDYDYKRLYIILEVRTKPSKSSVPVYC